MKSLAGSCGVTPYSVYVCGVVGAGDSEEEDRTLAMMGESERDWRYVERRGGGARGGRALELV